MCGAVCGRVDLGLLCGDVAVNACMECISCVLRPTVRAISLAAYPMDKQMNERATYCSGRISQTTHSFTGVCVFVQCQQFLIKPEEGYSPGILLCLHRSPLMHQFATAQGVAGRERSRERKKKSIA